MLRLTAMRGLLFLLSWYPSLNRVDSRQMVDLAFFSASLTPSLLPRAFVVQCILSGVIFAAAYGIGEAGHWICYFMELRDITGRSARLMIRILIGIPTLTAIYTLSQMTTWHNSTLTQS